MYKLKLVLKILKAIYNNLKYPKGAFRTQTSEKILCKNSQRPRAINSFHKKAPPPMLD